MDGIDELHEPCPRHEVVLGVNLSDTTPVPVWHALLYMAESGRISPNSIKRTVAIPGWISLLLHLSAELQKSIAAKICRSNYRI